LTKEGFDANMDKKTNTNRSNFYSNVRWAYPKIKDY